MDYRALFDSKKGRVSVDGPRVDEFVHAAMRSVQILANGELVDIPPGWDSDKLPSLEEVQDWCGVVNTVSNYQGNLFGAVAAKKVEHDIEVAYSVDISDEVLLTLRFRPGNAVLSWDAASQSDRFSEYMNLHLAFVMRHASAIKAGEAYL